jgi:hypothetical protein
LVRERSGYSHWWTAVLVEPVEMISSLMSQKMLRSIKQRAESLVRTGQVPTAR